MAASQFGKASVVALVSLDDCFSFSREGCRQWGLLALARKSEILLTNSNRYEPRLILQAVLLCLFGRPVLARVHNG